MAAPTSNYELSGPRLEFVLRKLPGTVKREVCSIATKAEREADPSIVGITRTVREEPAGYMIFFPTGACYRLSEEEAKRKGWLDREPDILSVEQAKDNKSNVGKFLFARSTAQKDKAYREMENDVIKACLRRVGTISNAVADYDEKGKMAA